jgi:hypothetical protein
MIQPGKITALCFAIIVVIFTVLYFYKKGEVPAPRLAAVDAISEGVDRAVEMGKPVHYTGGERADLTGVNTPMTVAMFSGLAYTAGLCAEKGARLIVHAPQTAEALPILQKIVYDQYALKGKLDKYDIRDIRFYGELYASGVLDSFARDGVATNIIIGAPAGESLVIQDHAKRHGALNIGGTARWIMQYSFAVLADYMLIAEEIYAAAAVMSKDPKQIATLRSGDIIKTISLALLIIGTLLSLAGSNAIQALLRW